jgi:hypothetical protein
MTIVGACQYGRSADDFYHFGTVLNSRKREPVSRRGDERHVPGAMQAVDKLPPAEDHGYRFLNAL